MNNLTLYCQGYLCKDWLKRSENSKYVVNTIAVHTSKEKTEFIDLVCNEKKVKGTKGEKLDIYGLPIVNVYKGKSKWMIFVDRIYDFKQEN